MSEHNPAAVLVRECPACDQHDSFAFMETNPIIDRAHAWAVQVAYLAERARVAEVVAAVDAALQATRPALTRLPNCGCDDWQDDCDHRGTVLAWDLDPDAVRAALAPFRETP